MSLADFEIRTEPVIYRGTTFADVRGIALRDITDLMHGHMAELNTVFDAYKSEANSDISMMRGAAFAMKMVNDVPDLVDQIIVRATDSESSPELLAKMAKYPLGLTVEILRKIIDMTVEDAGGAKKLWDNLVGMVETMRPTSQSQPD